MTDKELEGKLSELNNAITNAQEEHPDEVHCSCVPLLKVRIKELEEARTLEAQRGDHWLKKYKKLEGKLSELNNTIRNAHIEQE